MSIINFHETVLLSNKMLRGNSAPQANLSRILKFAPNPASLFGSCAIDAVAREVHVAQMSAIYMLLFQSVKKTLYRPYFLNFLNFLNFFKFF